MTFTRIILILVLFAAGAPSADNGGAITGTVAIEGEGDGIPVEGAEVTFGAALLRFRTVTGADGAFRFEGVPEGKGYTLTASKEGLRHASSTVTVRSGETVSTRIFLPASYLRLTSPNGGEAIFAGSEVPIRWESAGVDSLRIEFSINDGRDWILLERAAPAHPGVYIWDVQDIPSPLYRIRVSATGDPVHSDTSDAPFGNSSI